MIRNNVIIIVNDHIYLPYSYGEFPNKFIYKCLG